ncbi:hypothetical protein GCM10010493_70300 [Streptomyces lavendulae subsp. grasserius]
MATNFRKPTSATWPCYVNSLTGEEPLIGMTVRLKSLPVTRREFGGSTLQGAYSIGVNERSG